MLNRKLLLLAAAMAGLLFGTAAPASAQVTATQSEDPADRAAATTTDGRREQRGLTGFVAQTGNRRRSRQAAEATPEQNIAAAQAVAATAGVDCQVTEATYLGDTDAQEKAYEAACATGPGYILIGSTPPQTIDCVVLVAQAAADLARDPRAAPGLQCQIASNKDVLRVVAAYASEAGLSCSVDQGVPVGKSTASQAIIYEIGCNGADGAWIEKQATGWKVTPCFLVVSSNATCRFTTKAEQAATVKGWLAGSAAAGCDVTEARYMGANANGSFYEAKCGAGDGYIARFDTAMAVQQVYPCVDAARIGGGCQLTVVPAAATPQ